MTLSTPLKHLSMTRRYPVSSDLMFRVWTEPEHLQRWFFELKPGASAHADVDLRVDGAYRVSLHGPDGEVIYAVAGRYRAIEAPAKLVMSWCWEAPAKLVMSWCWEVPPMDNVDTVVTVIFTDLGHETEVAVIHEVLPDQNPCWDNRLNRLGQVCLN
jgi:uncharacterized protein YndB with AHSA1/START domain